MTLLAALALPAWLAALALPACDEGNANRLKSGDIALEFSDDLHGKPVVIRFWADWCRYRENDVKAIERVW